MRKLDISFNPGIKFVDFDRLILKYDMVLTSLSFEGNGFGDNIVVKIAEAIGQRPLLKDLNLSQNMITNKGAIALANLLYENNTLVSLYLRWNFIKAKAAVALSDAIRDNATLLVLDLSFNPLGENLKPAPVIQASNEKLREDVNLIGDVNDVIIKSYLNVSKHFSKMFEKNKTLLHADFSH